MLCQCITPTPLGERYERFPLDEALPDADPLDGSTLSVSHAWVDDKLVSTATPQQVSARVVG